MDCTGSCSCAVAARKRQGDTLADRDQTTDGTSENFSAALMPLLHQDTSRGGGGSREHRRSLADLFAVDHSIRATASTGDEWRWKEPGSPEAAQTPRSLVPPNCFPPRHPRNFASFSESARPGSGWSDDSCPGQGQGITDLVASLKALAMPSGGAGAGSPRVQTSIQMRLSYEHDEPDKNLESLWPELAGSGRDERGLSRRASFCGVVSSGRNGSTALRWEGTLPARCSDPSGGFSPKVFLGGLPWDITETALLHALRHFQPIRVEWPNRDAVVGGVSSGGPRGFAYVLLESERRVRALLAASRRDGPDWYYRVASRKMRSKEVQVIPWAVSDSSWVCGGQARLEPARTVFVGALHGMLSARALATIMNDLFSGVVYAGIDTDKNKYPIGSGRVTFNNVRSYVRAVSAGYVDIQTDKFSKKVQVDPYLEDSMCSVCNLHQGPYFCREPVCFRYFCRSCWQWQHPADEHKPLMRSSKSNGAVSGALTNGALPNGVLANGPRHPPPDYTAGFHADGNVSFTVTGALTNGALPNGVLTNGPRHPPPDYTAGFHADGNATPSPSTSGSGSGASGTSGTSAGSASEHEHTSDEQGELALWPR
ncbi:cytoplasmic polyadenylation element-binding protein ZZ domain-containing protein [Phthorimaea operculella]|nr:cytoplasmic polyadenylation element-binding protein ZZ domain-containing protein [Phthorimaea operculella]